MSVSEMFMFGVHFNVTDQRLSSEIVGSITSHKRLSGKEKALRGSVVVEGVRLTYATLRLEPHLRVSSSLPNANSNRISNFVIPW
jgi:hypothetical protein